MKLILITALLLALVVLSGCSPSEEQYKIDRCINQSGTNVIGTQNISQCKLYVCLVENQVGMALYKKSDLIACKTALVMENS